MCAGCDKQTVCDDCKACETCGGCAAKCGCAEFDRPIKCAGCEKIIECEDSRQGTDGDDYCEDCFSESFTYCDRCGDVAHIDDCRATPGSDTYCESCFDSHCTECRNCGETIWRDDARETPDGSDWCDSCWCDACSICDGCGGVYWSDDLHYNDCGVYCSDCRHGDEEWETTRFRGRDEYSKMPSRRKFGVELETDDCNSHEDLQGNTCFGAKHDGSINGKEFVSPVLYGDGGFAEIDKIARFARENGWTVDDSCGYHAHFDVTDESVDSLKGIALAFIKTYEVWSEFVDCERKDNTYCKASHVSMSEVAACSDFTYWVGSRDRYRWINFAAYTKHRTFEVRLHHGTLDGRAICNWVAAIAIFMDWASKAGFDGVKRQLWLASFAERFDFIARLWQDAGRSDLVEYYLNKARANNAEWVESSVFTRHAE